MQLMDVVRAMQAWKLVPEAYLVEPSCDLPAVDRNDLEDGICMFVLCADIPVAIAILSNPQANKMCLATWLRFPRVCQLGVNLEQ